MSTLHTELAPIGERAWTAIENDVRTAMREQLVGRRIADFEGPHGLEYASSSTGRQHVLELGAGIRGAVREVQPVVELKVPFTLRRSEVDTTLRGTVDFDTGPGVQAALLLSEWEDRIILTGSTAAGIRGIAEGAPDVLPLGDSTHGAVDALVRASILLGERGVGGPYAAVINSDLYASLAGEAGTYPPLKHLEKVLGSPVLHSKVPSGGVVVSLRGGDFVLQVGLDCAIGYAAHDAESIELYLLESFTFELRSPEAAVRLGA